MPISFSKDLVSVNGLQTSSDAFGLHDRATAGKSRDADRLQRAVLATPSEDRVAARETMPYLFDEMKRQGVSDTRQQAYILATVEHESHFGANGYNVELSDGTQYEHRSDLGNVLSGDGPKFKGRGDVQITGRANYTYFAKKFGVDLVHHPEKALERGIASAIAVDGMKEGTYTGLHVSVRHPIGDDIIEHISASGGRKLDDFIHGSHVDYVGARSIVNGQDDADAIARQAERYAEALRGQR